MSGGLILRERTPEYASYVTCLQQRQVKWDPGNASGESKDEITPLPGNAAQCWLRIVAAHRIEHDMRPVRPDRALEIVGQRLGDGALREVKRINTSSIRPGLCRRQRFYFA